MPALLWRRNARRNSACRTAPANALARRRQPISTQKQQALVVAIVTENDAEQAKLQADMTQAEMAAAGDFMTSAPGSCAAQ